MSAVNVLLGDGEAHVITDGAGTFLGALYVTFPKVLPVPHLGIVIAFRGRVGLQSSILFRAARARTVDDLREKLPRHLRQSFGLRTKILPQLYSFDLTVAGVSDGKAFAFFISSIAHSGFEPFTAVEIGHGLCSPPLSDESLADGWNSSGRDKSRSLDAAAVRILDDQRSSGRIGAFGQITSISQFGIYTRIIKRYPDEVGRPLDGQ